MAGEIGVIEVFLSLESLERKTHRKKHRKNNKAIIN